MRLPLSAIAERLCLPREGFDVPDLAPALMEQAGVGSVSLATSDRFIVQARHRGVSALIVPPGLDCPIPCLRAERPRIAFAQLLQLFDQRSRPPEGKHATAVVHPSAQIGAGVTLGPHVVIEEGVILGAGTRVGANGFIGAMTEVGAECEIGPNVTVYGGCSLGERVRLKAGAVIGGEGFGYEWDGSRHVRVPHLGSVIIEDDVEIGSNSCIDRAKIHETRIRRGTKIDNLVQVAHGVHLGRNCMLASQVGIAGSSQVGDGCMFGGQSGVVDNVTIGDRSVFSAASSVFSDIEGGATYMGTPAREASRIRRFIVSQHLLPDLFRRVRRLEAGGPAEADHTTKPAASD